MKKKSLVLFLVLALMLSSVIMVGAEEMKSETFKMLLHGEEVNIPEEYGNPFIDNNDRTMVPLRFISEQLGHEVEWIQETQTVVIDTDIRLNIGENTVITPEGIMEMDTVAVLLDGRTYVPIRFIANALEYSVAYDGTGKLGSRHAIDIYETGTTSILNQEEPTLPEETLPVEPVEVIQENSFEKFIGVWVYEDDDTSIPIIEITEDTLMVGWYASEMASESIILSKTYDENGSVLVGLETLDYGMDPYDESDDVYLEESLKLTSKGDILVVETEDGFVSEWTFGSKTLEAFDGVFNNLMKQ